MVRMDAVRHYGIYRICGENIHSLPNLFKLDIATGGIFVFNPYTTMKKLLTLKNHFTGNYYHGEILKETPHVWLMRVTHSASILHLAKRMEYKDAQYPDSIRTFFKEFSTVCQ